MRNDDVAYYIYHNNGDYNNGDNNNDDYNNDGNKWN